MRHATRIAILVLGTALGIALLWLLLRSVNLGQLRDDLATGDYRYLALLIVPFLANLLLKIPRWSLLFGHDAPSNDTLFGALNVGYAVNALFPARLGEIIRAYWVRDRSGTGMVRTLSTIALERTLDGLTLLLFLLIAVPTVAIPRTLLGPALTIGAVFIAALLAMAVIAYTLSRENHPLAGLLRALEAGRWSFIPNAVGQIVAGLTSLRNRRTLVLVGVYTLVIWLANAAMVWLALRAFHLAIPFTGALLLTAVLNLGMAVPSSPGYVGVFEYLMVLTLGLYGIGHTPALAAALVFHAISFVPVTLIGLFYIARLGLGTTVQLVRAGVMRGG